MFEKESYKDWCNKESHTQSDILQKTTVNLLASVQALQYLLQSETTMEPSRVFRIQVAMNHLLVEIHLLDISKEKV